MTVKQHSKILFRLENGVVNAVVEGAPRVVRGKIKDAMKRFVNTGSPKSLSFTDAQSGRSFRVQLAAVETWKVSRFG